MSDIKTSKKESKYILENTSGMPEIFCDGMTSLMVGSNVSKIVFHTILNPKDDESPEVRKAVLSLIMTTPSLLLFCRRVLEAAKHSSDTLLASEGNNAKLEQLLDEITFTRQSKS